MEFSGGNYKISTGSQDTGLIYVHQSEIQHGIEESKEQKATTLLPRLKNLDSKILNKLVEYGIVDIKKPKLEDLMMDDLMSSMHTDEFIEEPQIVEEEKKEEKK